MRQGLYRYQFDLPIGNAYRAKDWERMIGFVSRHADWNAARNDDPSKNGADDGFYEKFPIARRTVSIDEFMRAMAVALYRELAKDLDESPQPSIEGIKAQATGFSLSVQGETPVPQTGARIVACCHRFLEEERSTAPLPPTEYNWTNGAQSGAYYCAPGRDPETRSPDARVQGAPRRKNPRHRLRI